MFFRAALENVMFYSLNVTIIPFWFVLVAYQANMVKPWLYIGETGLFGLTIGILAPSKYLR